jgi:hypothetical protein
MQASNYMNVKHRARSHFLIASSSQGLIRFYASFRTEVFKFPLIFPSVEIYLVLNPEPVGLCGQLSKSVAARGVGLRTVMLNRGHWPLDM